MISFGKDGLNLLGLGGATPHIRTRQVVESLEMLTDLASFPAQRRLTEDATEQAYASRGFSLHAVPRTKKRQPTLEDVHAILKKKARRVPEAAEAARRLRTLLLSSGKSFCSSTIGMDSLLSGLVCVDLHSLPSESLRSLAGLAILQFVKEKMRAESYRSEGKPRLFVVVDEAWKIAADERSDVIAIVREGRKYGFGLIVASQNPTDVHKSIFSNAGTSVIFRLTLASEREYVRSSLTYSDYYEAASHTMKVGQALVHLEAAQAGCGPRNFILEKIDGEPLLLPVRISGGGMDIEIEKEEMMRKLLSFGLTEKQSSEILAEFERRNFSLDAGRFSELLEGFGHGRASAISLLRELGAGEKELLAVYSSQNGRGAAPGAQEAVLELKEESKHRAEPHERRARGGSRA
ncbi:DNA double-strand break repair helicase HerA [uncultured archaeon]|nr:DNA double-strand break repair helicase HerA [uncultured archaeon]